MGKAHHIALAAALAAATPALAQERGFYLGISGGYSSIDIDTGDIDAAVRGLGAATSSTSGDESDEAWKAFGGFQFNRYFALEIGYINFGEYSLTTRTTGPAATVNGEFEGDGWSLDAIGTLPLNDRFALFGRAGAVRWDVDARAAAVSGGTLGTVSESDDGVSWKAGLGAKYSFSRNLDARLEWEHYNDIGENDTTGQSDVDVFSLGLILKF